MRSGQRWAESGAGPRPQQLLSRVPRCLSAGMVTDPRRLSPAPLALHLRPGSCRRTQPCRWLRLEVVTAVLQGPWALPAICPAVLARQVLAQGWRPADRGAQRETESSVRSRRCLLSPPPGCCSHPASRRSPRLRFSGVRAAVSQKLPGPYLPRALALAVAFPGVS